MMKHQKKIKCKRAYCTKEEKKRKLAYFALFDVKFACAVKVFPYPNEIFSVWVFLLSECEKQNTV